MGLNWRCTRFLIACSYQSGRSHSPQSIPVDCIVVVLALPGFVTESVNFTFLPSFHFLLPKNILLFWATGLYLSVERSDKCCGLVRMVDQHSQGEAGRRVLCLVVTNQLSHLWSHSLPVNWSGWDTDMSAYPDLAERWERHLWQWWLKLSQQDFSELVSLNLTDVSILSCHFALSSECIWGESLITILS